MVSRIVQLDPLLQMGERGLEFALVERHEANGIVPGEDNGRVLGRLGHGPKAPSHVARRARRSPNEIKPPEAEQHGKEPRVIVHLAAQLQCARVGPLDLGSRISLHGRQRRAEHHVRGQFLLNALLSAG